MFCKSRLSEQSNVRLTKAYSPHAVLAPANKSAFPHVLYPTCPLSPPSTLSPKGDEKPYNSGSLTHRLREFAAGSETPIVHKHTHCRRHIAVLTTTSAPTDSPSARSVARRPVPPCTSSNSANSQQQPPLQAAASTQTVCSAARLAMTIRSAAESAASRHSILFVVPVTTEDPPGRIVLCVTTCCRRWSLL